MSRDREDSRRERSNERGGGEARTASILVKNLNRSTTQTELREEFDGFGEIRDIYIPRDYHTREPKGFAFVEFLERDSALNAIEKVHETELFGRTVTVELAREKRKTPEEMRRNDRRGGGGRRGGYRDRDRSRSRDRRRRYSRSRSRDRGRSRSRDRYDRRRGRSRS